MSPGVGVPPADGPRPSVRAVLRFRGFRFFIAATLVSLFGSEVFNTVLPFLVLETLGTAKQLAFVLTTASIGQAVLVLVGGVFVDRYQLRRLLIETDAVRFSLEVVC